MVLTSAQFLPTAQMDTLWVTIGSPWNGLLLWLLAINLLTFCAFGVDKLKAIRKEANPKIRRIPERNLLLSAFLGGSLGALLAMLVFHHKTLHPVFRKGVPAALALHLLLLIGLSTVFPLPH